MLYFALRGLLTFESKNEILKGYSHVVLFNNTSFESLDAILELCDNSNESYRTVYNDFRVVLFIMLYRALLKFESANENY